MTLVDLVGVSPKKRFVPLVDGVEAAVFDGDYEGGGTGLSRVIVTFN